MTGSAANRIDQSSAGRDHLRRYERELVVPAGGLIVVWARRRPAQTANTFAEFYPHARVLLLSRKQLSGEARARLRPGVEAETAVSVDAVDQLLVTRPRPCVIIDSGSIRDEERTQAFRRLFLHLAPGGVYAVEDLQAEETAGGAPGSVRTLLTRLVSLTHLTDAEKLAAQPSAERELAASIDRLAVHGRIAFITRQGSHLVKVHEKDVERVLAARVGSDRFRRLEMVPAQRRAVLGSFWSNNEEHSRRLLRDVREEIPELVARVHSDAVCAPRGWPGGGRAAARVVHPAVADQPVQQGHRRRRQGFRPGRGRRAGWTARTSTSTTRSRGTTGTSPPRISRSSGRGTRRRPPTPTWGDREQPGRGHGAAAFPVRGARRLRHRPGGRQGHHRSGAGGAPGDRHPGVPESEVSQPSCLRAVGAGP